ncbi:Lrp/AsnC family transcriptional regulator [Roseovarius salinarum]|uniref:Lrp/AsnC family transcriptional regulator n=1 Tax=Roseovarius salinarum TaxID=1981892 RepID=UPI000C347D41|nr:Lrp/AsnC family transcriptional regulator [Roseovarius salinarum]
MDSIDRRIIAQLQRDGRQRLSALSQAVGLSPTPCARRVARLEDAGVIAGYSARVDQEKLGLPLNVFIFVELEKQTREAIDTFEAALRRFDEVMECYLMTGTRDVLIRVVAADLSSFDRFLEHGLMQTPGIRSMRSSFALRAMIRRDVLPGVG